MFAKLKAKFMQLREDLIGVRKAAHKFDADAGLARDPVGTVTTKAINTGKKGINLVINRYSRKNDQP